MNVFVCIKQVPDTETKIKITADNGGIDPAGIKWVMNPYDEYAVEEALKFKAANAAAIVTVVTVGPKTRAVEVLRTALAMGADEAVVVDAPEACDLNSTAAGLAKAIQSVGAPHLIFTGKLSIDDNAGSVSQMVAELLAVPHCTVVSKATYSGDAATVEREIEGGAREVIEMKYPCLIAANKGLNTPRYASLPGIMKAKKKTIKELTLGGLGVAATEAKSRYTKFELPPDRPAVKMLSGDPGAQSRDLVKFLREEAKVI